MISSERRKQLDQVCKRLRFRFRKRRLLHQALTHRSFTHEQRQPEEWEDNERLELLGDAVLDLIICHHLFERRPDLREGDLTKLKASAVGRTCLGRIARHLSLGDTLLLGKGEAAARGQRNITNEVGALEAVLGAVYLDAGLGAVRKMVLRIWQDEVDVILAGGGEQDYKSALQEYCLKHFHIPPKYRVVKTEGPAHNTNFELEVAIKGQVYGRGKGRSKKAAQQEAAEATLKSLLQELRVSTQVSRKSVSK